MLTKPSSKLVSLSFGVLVLLFAIGFYVSGAWSPPTGAPPANNVAAPLNVGPSNQTKTGGLLNVFGLWVNQSLGVSGSATFGGNVGIGTTSPSTTLDVNGPVRVGRYGTKPACDANTLGSFVFDTTINKPYICVSGGVWKPLVLTLTATALPMQ